jgi:hypothetical protein
MWQGLKQTGSLEEQLAEEAKRLREQAELLPPGAVRNAVLQKALGARQRCPSGCPPLSVTMAHIAG